MTGKLQQRALNRSLHRLGIYRRPGESGAEAEMAARVVKAWIDRGDRGPTPEERAAVKKMVREAKEAIRAEKEAIAAGAPLVTSKMFKRAREMLELEWEDVSILSGLIPSTVIRAEHGGPTTVCDRQTLRTFYEQEGLRFTQDGVECA